MIVVPQELARLDVCVGARERRQCENVDKEVLKDVLLIRLLVTG